MSKFLIDEAGHVYHATPQLIIEMNKGRQKLRYCDAPNKAKPQPIAATEHADFDTDASDEDSGMSVEDAINLMESGNQSLWNDDGTPKLKPISDILGRKVSAVERDQAWATIVDQS